MIWPSTVKESCTVLKLHPSSNYSFCRFFYHFCQFSFICFGHFLLWSIYWPILMTHNWGFKRIECSLKSELHLRGKYKHSYYCLDIKFLLANLSAVWFFFVINMSRQTLNSAGFARLFNFSKVRMQFFVHHWVFVLLLAELLENHKNNKTFHLFTSEEG